ncbi:MAG: ABC transporter permease [Helicobacter sp.]|nr:ABC transporter permease [Helicobacter sp.]
MDANKLFFCRSIARSLCFSWHKVAVIVFALFIGTAVSAAFLNLSFDITSKLRHELKVYGANFVIAPNNAPLTPLTMERYQSALAKIPRESLKAASPFLFASLSLESNSALVAGVSLDSMKALQPFLQASAGHFGQSVFAEDSIFVGQQLAKALELKPAQKLTITDPKTLNAQTFVVQGIVSSGGAFDGMALIAIAPMQRLLETQNLHYAQAVLYGDFASIRAIAEELSDDSIVAKPIMQVASSEGAILGKMQSLMLLVCLVVLAIASLSVNNTLSALIFARKKQIALHLSLGASVRDIRYMLGAEVAAMCAVAILLGALCGFGLANVLGWAIFDSSVRFRFLPFVLAIGIAMFFSFISAYYPLKKALKINIATNLKGE